MFPTSRLSKRHPCIHNTGSSVVEGGKSARNLYDLYIYRYSQASANISYSADTRLLSSTSLVLECRQWEGMILISIKFDVRSLASPASEMDSLQPSTEVQHTRCPARWRMADQFEYVHSPAGRQYLCFVARRLVYVKKAVPSLSWVFCVCLSVRRELRHFPYTYSLCFSSSIQNAWC